MAELNTEGLKALQAKAEKLDGLSIPELMTDGFIRQNTKFDNFREFADASGIKDAAEIGGDDFNLFVRQNTVFADWREMLDKAVADYIIE